MCADAIYLEENAANATEQLWLLLGVVLDHRVVGVHSQHVVLERKAKQNKKVNPSGIIQNVDLPAQKRDCLHCL